MMSKMSASASAGSAAARHQSAPRRLSAHPQWLFAVSGTPLLDEIAQRGKFGAERVAGIVYHVLADQLAIFAEIRYGLPVYADVLPMM